MGHWPSAGLGLFTTWTGGYPITVSASGRTSSIDQSKSSHTDLNIDHLCNVYCVNNSLLKNQNPTQSCPITLEFLTVDPFFLIPNFTKLRLIITSNWATPVHLFIPNSFWMLIYMTILLSVICYFLWLSNLKWSTCTTVNS